MPCADGVDSIHPQLENHRLLLLCNPTAFPLISCRYLSIPRHAGAMIELETIFVGTMIAYLSDLVARNLYLP